MATDKYRLATNGTACPATAGDEHKQLNNHGELYSTYSTYVTYATYATS
ncbi:MAG: hypothetical protein NTW29_01190 [Bacteroidetes bacterium]|nr:hypothetical protein [Bacteroidota bacterium]